MKRTVLIAAYPFAPVSADAAGGAEQVVSMLDSALVRAGHRSVVAACGGSETKGHHIALPVPDGPLDERTRGIVHERYREAVREALATRNIDIVHMHGLDFDRYLPPAGPPVLVTLHLPVHWYPPAIFSLERPRTYLHCVSSAQRRECPRGAALLPEIENGVPVDDLYTGVSKRDFVVSLGRICPEKGFHIALDAARRAGTAMFLAGEVFRYETHERYFHEEIAPRLDGRRYRFIGRAGFERKRRLLTAARCLLVPSLAPETSSLVAMESLACGTPVVAFRSGALADIIEHGKTGFLVQDGYEMAGAIREAARLDPGYCRKVAGARFSARAMTDKYLDLYERLVAGNMQREKNNEQ